MQAARQQVQGDVGSKVGTKERWGWVISERYDLRARINAGASVYVPHRSWAVSKFCTASVCLAAGVRSVP